MTTKRTLAELFSFEPYRPYDPAERERQPQASLVDLPACSGDAWARALERCGMLRFDEGSDVFWMERGTSFVAVPACGTVPRETLAEILDESGLSPHALLRHLHTAPDPIGAQPRHTGLAKTPHV
jgi:hypothetical protein